MHVDVASLVVNLGRHEQGIDWALLIPTTITAGTTLLAAFIGIKGGYYSNVKQDALKLKQNRIEAYNKILIGVQFLYSDLIRYTEALQGAKKINYGEDFPAPIVPHINFEINILEYSFLSRYNPYFPSLLNGISTNLGYIFKLIDSYNSAFLIFQDPSQPGLRNSKGENCTLKESLSEVHATTLRLLEETIILCYIFLENMYKTKEMLLNCAYNTSVVENFHAHCGIKEVIQDYKDREIFKNWSKEFEKTAPVKPNIYDYYNCKVRKIKYCFYILRDFFTKPKRGEK